MKVIYDPEQDVLHIALLSAIVEETTQISPGLVLDYDEDGQVIGLEIRKASMKTDSPFAISFNVGKANVRKPIASCPG